MKVFLETIKEIWLLSLKKMPYFFPQSLLILKDIAEKLEYLMEQGRKGLGEPVTVDGKWLVRTDEARGVIVCPWEDGVFKKINVTVDRTDIKKSISYTDLSIHMLKEHGFLEGRGAPFRLEPSVLAEVLY